MTQSTNVFLAGTGIALLAPVGLGKWLSMRWLDADLAQRPFRTGISKLLPLLVLSALAAGVGLGASPASAWNGLTSNDPYWQAGDCTAGEGGTVCIVYYLNSAGSDDVGFDQLLPEVRRGMEDWTRLECSGLRVQFGPDPANPSSGITDGRIGSGPDGIVQWVESGWRHSSSAIGVTSVGYSGDRLFSADMEMNGVNFQWSLSPSGSQVDVYSISLHEFGHWIGLGHSGAGGAVMAPAYSPGSVLAITADDTEGVCTLYPGEGVAGCEDASDCPSGQECVGGACQDPPPTGGGEVCSPCTESGECGGATDICLTYPNGSGYCGRNCTDDSDCGGDTCRTLSNGARQCIRLVGGEASCEGDTPPPGECTSDSGCEANERCDAEAGRCVGENAGGADIGAPCVDGGQCASNTCLLGTCTRTCDWPSGACPENHYCDGTATGACGVAMCRPGVAGLGSLGSTCSGHGQCASLHCQDGTCRQPCIPGSVDSCGDGRICQAGALACRGGCGTAGSLGDPCRDNVECASNICANSHCTQACSAAEPCPSAYRCAQDAAIPVCIPEGAQVGEPCAQPDDCTSGLCAQESEEEGGPRFCTRYCDPDSSPCPNGMECLASAGGERVCAPMMDSSPGDDRVLSGACSVGVRPHESHGPLGVLMALGLFAWLRRRRRA